MENSEQKKLDQQELKELYNLRDKLAQTMQPIFGEYQEQMTRIVFKKWTNKRIGQILGYSNIGRYLQSPNLNKNQPRQDAFNSLVAKVELLSKHIEKPVKENQRLRKIINFLGVASLLLFGLCGWLWISSKNAHNNYRLTNSERQAVMDLYSENIQMKLALEAVKFQSNYQKEVLRDSLPYHLQEFKERIPTEILTTRSMLRRTNLKAESGTPLIKIVENNTHANNIDENFKDLAVAFTNGILPPHTVIEMVRKKVNAAQIENRKLMDLEIENSLQ